MHNQPTPSLIEANHSPAPCPHSGSWSPLEEKSHNHANWPPFNSVTTALKPVLTTGQQPCPMTLVISLSHFLRCYPNFSVVKPPRHLPSSWADSIILCFFEKIGMTRGEWFSSPVIKSSCLLAFMPKYSAFYPVTGNELSPSLSKTTWALHSLRFHLSRDFIATIIPYLSRTSIDSSILNQRNASYYLWLWRDPIQVPSCPLIPRGPILTSPSW